MNENIGTFFSEARQAKGLSVDAAADAMRIKVEYIQAIENGTFNFNLPDIYRRGFYKSYANFLDLNLEEMMAKCPIKPFETLESSQKRREMVSQVAKKTQEVNHEHIKTSFTDDIDNLHESPTEGSAPKTVALKIGGIIFASAALLFLVLYGIIAHTTEKQKKEIERDDISELIQKKITIHSSSDVKIMIRSEEDKSKIFSGTLANGSEKVIIYKKPIQVYFDKGEALTIEMENGEYLHPDSGRGGLQIK